MPQMNTTIQALLVYTRYAKTTRIEIAASVATHKSLSSHTRDGTNDGPLRHTGLCMNLPPVEITRAIWVREKQYATLNHTRAKNHDG